MNLKFLAVGLVVGSAAVSVADPLVFQAFLDGPSESPPNASPGTGFTTVTIDPVAHTLRVQAEFSGLVAGVTASHIHVINGPGDVNTGDTLGPVATQTPSFAGFPAGVTSGTYDGTFDTTLTSSFRAGWVTDSGGTAATAEAALFAGIMDGRAYLNIHSSTFPGGEIRGFLQLVPEPATVTALAMAGVGLLIKRRTRR